MNCDACTELLADFLLDELPESQAVLVQEHLNLCPACMKTYRELKGTGKALEAVPVMRAAQPSREFGQAVRAQASVELAAVVDKLPADKRLRLEARRAARRSQSMPHSTARRSSPWTSPLMLMSAVVAVIILALVVVNQKDPGQVIRAPMGKLSLTNGKADQFFQRENVPHTPAQEGREIMPGDAFLTAEGGCARFDLIDGSAVFLGPTSSATFRVGDGKAPMVDLETGEIGVLRGAKAEAAGNEPIEVRCSGVRLTLSPDAHVYMRLEKKGKDVSGTVSVLAGSVQAWRGAQESIGSASAGTRLKLNGPGDATSEALPDNLVPAWRVELASDTDLSRLIKAPFKVLRRSIDGIEAELNYGQSTARSAAGKEDWTGEESINPRPDGKLTLPQRAKLKHAIPFAAPLKVEVAINSDSPRDATLAFGLVDSTQGSVSVDISNDATMQVRESNRPTRSATIPARKTTSAERLMVDVVRENTSLTAVLSSGAGKSKILPLQRDKAAGELWIQALSENIVLDEIKIRAIIPADWLRERMSK